MTLATETRPDWLDDVWDEVGNTVTIVPIGGKHVELHQFGGDPYDDEDDEDDEDDDYEDEDDDYEDDEDDFDDEDDEEDYDTDPFYDEDEDDPNLRYDDGAETPGCGGGAGG